VVAETSGNKLHLHSVVTDQGSVGLIITLISQVGSSKLGQVKSTLSQNFVYFLSLSRQILGY
jgi:hypothetical protein